MTHWDCQAATIRGSSGSGSCSGSGNEMVLKTLLFKIVVSILVR